MPPKIRSFLWLLAHNRLPTRQHLHRIGVIPDATCLFYLQSNESVNHIFLHCPNVKTCWINIGLQRIINSINRFSNPSQWIQHLYKYRKKLMPHKINPHTFLSFTLWSIWTTRNDNNFNHCHHNIPLKQYY